MNVLLGIGAIMDKYPIGFPVDFIDIKSELYPRLMENQKVSFWIKVSVQGVVTLGGHFATLCHEVDFNEAIFPLFIFKKKRQIILHF